MSRALSTESDNKPTLISKNLTLGSIRKKINDDRLKTTETDMMFEKLADENKLINKEEWKTYNKSNNDDNRSKDSSSSSSSSSSERRSSSHHHDEHHDEYKNDTGPSIDASRDTFNPFDLHAKKPKDDDNSEEKPKKLSPTEERRSKLHVIRRLGELQQLGVHVSKDYTLRDDLDEMQMELDMHLSIRAKSNAINWMTSMMLNCVFGLEMLNDKYDPFSIHLKGWSEQMNADITNYQDVFGELFEKYSAPGKTVAPEIKIMMMISGSALKFHLAHAVFNNLPGMADSLKNNPALAEQLRRQAVADKMKEQTVKQNEALNKKMTDEHQKANKEVNDERMMKAHQEQYERGQEEMAKKQAQLEMLQNQLEESQSNERSNQPQMRMPIIPQGMNINRPQQPPTNVDAVRQQQIREQREQFLKKQEMMNKLRMDQVEASDASVGGINPNLDDLITKSINESRDTRSHRSRRGRPRKIKVDV